MLTDPAQVIPDRLEEPIDVVKTVSDKTPHGSKCLERVRDRYQDETKDAEDVLQHATDRRGNVTERPESFLQCANEVLHNRVRKDVLEDRLKRAERLSQPAIDRLGNRFQSLGPRLGCVLGGVPELAFKERQRLAHLVVETLGRLADALEDHR